ncbi:S9 family peptidase [Mycobacterium spongiae]|uniref:Prolyl oligopeptidase family serine peptidase n=1 Tax=Mycobacterium spongiae TaxID=886343 RepID=A0A975PWE4_9MYCO|nr:S9 family peptidase [Mycobacterium spongiae]QUR67075.1 prolyl oligopeptidase family serine peptidase [Mycobacterium spongiae]
MAGQAELALAPPSVSRRPSQRERHGDVFTDHYGWLDATDDPEVIAHYVHENRYTDQQTRHLHPLSQSIFEEISARTEKAGATTPVRRGKWWYYSRYCKGQPYRRHFRCPVAQRQQSSPPLIAEEQSSDEQLVLDENIEAQDHDFFALGAAAVSPDGKVLAYTVDTKGDERFALRLKPLDNQPRYACEIGDIAPCEPNDRWSSVAWASDSRTLYYVTIDDTGRPDTVWRCTLGANQPAECVFHESDTSFNIVISRTRSGKYIFIASHSLTTSEVRYGRTDDRATMFRVVLERRTGVSYTLDHAVLRGEDRFVIAHNHNALNFTVIDAPIADPAQQRTLMAHRSDVYITAVDAFANYVAISSRCQAVSRVELIPIDSAGQYGHPDAVRFDNELMSATLAENPDWDAPTCRIQVTSYVTPPRVCEVDVTAAHRVRVLKQEPVFGGFRPEDYVERREWALAADGTRVPISIIYRRGLILPAPTLLYGYGAFGCCDDSWFSIPRLSVLDRGMVFAVAHVRGGGDLGRRWHEHGRGMNKQNSITDFVAVAEHLTQCGVTRSQSLVAFGGSAGGLLVGAAVNISPELFAGVLAVVPVVDPLTAMLDPGSYVDMALQGELGDPALDVEVYNYIKKYSPYENIGQKKYPSILAVAALRDTRVAAVSSAKWVAALRHMSIGDAPVLLKTEMAAGHTGISGRYAQWEQAAFEYAWMLNTARNHHQSAVPVP